MSEQPAIEIRSVTKRFGRKTALDGLTMSVESGQTFAFLGRNGAGKTTAIRMLLGLIKPDSGSIRVLGLDPQQDPIGVRRQVGYLAEDQAMFGWMRVSEMISFMAPFYPTWDAAWAKELANRFELPMRTRTRHLSKGQGVRLGLLLALAHRPKLVILDDPTLGLDPIMRKEFLRDVVTYLQGERVTVFFSSHLLYEIDAVTDSVAILDRHHIIRQAETEELRTRVKRIIAPAEAEPMLRDLPGLLDFSRSDRQATAVVENIDAALAAARTWGTPFDVVDLNLDEIFEAYVIGRRKEQPDAPACLERVA